MLRRFLFGFYCLVFFLCALTAQPVTDDLPVVTNCIALINAKMISAPGKAPQKSTIIVRDGLITHVGQNISIPSDAYRIAADSFFAYPAFIDAFSSIGIKEQESSTNTPGQGGAGNRNQKPAIDAEGNMSLEDAGITPFRSVRSSLDAKEKSIADWRAQGFAIAHVVPKGKMIHGKGSILVLSGNNIDKLIWKEDMSLFGQWVGTGGNYPSTVIGVMAKWRELYQNASNNVLHQTSYANASLISRPDYNQAHEALMPLVKKEIPLYFRAPKVKDISRALSMQSELGMKMVIADVEQAWYLKEQLKAKSIPVILSLVLPEDKSEVKKEKEKEKEEKDKPISVPAPDSTKTIEGEKPIINPEKEAFEKRRAESLKEHRAQAATLTAAGVPFSFGTMSIKTSDFYKNIQLIKEQGLTDDQALSALTTQPAKLLGIEKYTGTIEVGKMANIIISNKPVFQKEAAIRYMIVEGALYEYEVKEKKKKETKSRDNIEVVTGAWDYEIETPDKIMKGTFEFANENGEITGKITSDEITSGIDELENVELEGDKLSFTLDFEMNGELYNLEFNLTLKEETMDGTVTVGELGKFPVEANRIAKPKN